MFRIPLRKGRLIDEHDVASAPWVVVINEAFAKKYFPNEDPLGKQIRLRFDPYPVEEDRPRQIVGVVADTKNSSLSHPTDAYMYVSSQQRQAIMPGGTIETHNSQTVLLKLKTGDKGLEAQVVAAMRQAISEVDPNVLLLGTITLDEVLDLYIGDFFFYRNMLAIFAGIALLLAVIGIYGVMSYFVNARTHEIGVRVALGALPRDVLELIGGLGFKLSVIGVVIGAGLAPGTNTPDREITVRRETDRPADLRNRGGRTHRRSAAGLLHPRPPRHKSRPHGRPPPRINFPSSAADTSQTAK